MNNRPLQATPTTPAAATPRSNDASPLASTSATGGDQTPRVRSSDTSPTHNRRAFAAATVQGVMLQVVSARLGPGPLAEDVTQRMITNAQVLRRANITTGQAVRDFVSDCYRHDALLATTGLGLTGNAGYFVGMTAANEKLAALLPQSILTNPPALGAVLGLGVGALDVLISVAGGAALEPKLYNGTDGAQLPPSVPQPSALHVWVKNVARATGLNVLKNLTRPIAPLVQGAVEGALGHAPPGTIDRIWSDRIDASVLDGGLGFMSTAAKELLKLGDGVPYDLRLLLRADLDAVIGKVQGNDPPGAVAGRVGRALASPAVPLAVVATIGAFISALISANTAIDEHGHARLDPLPPDRADMGITVAKRVSGVLAMGLMTAAIEIGAPLVGKGAAAATNCLRGAAWPDIGGWARGALAQANTGANS